MKSQRILLALIIVTMMLAPAALAAMTGLPNPIHEATRTEAEAAAGEFFYLPPLPQGVLSANYSYIDAPAGDPDGVVIAQAVFNDKGTHCVLRGARTDELRDISGMHYDWAFDRAMRLGVFLGRVMFLEGGPGVAQWYDMLQSASYSVSVDEGATLEKLMTLANSMAEYQYEEPPEIPGEDLNGIVLPGLAWAKETNADTVIKALGFPLDAPQGAENARYYLFPTDGPTQLAAVRYELDGVQQIHWARRNGEVFDVSEVYYPWPRWQIAALGPVEAILSYEMGGEGLITWFDQEAGVNHAVAVVRHASPETLLSAATPFL